jgi:hypothetical protein
MSEDSKEQIKREEFEKLTRPLIKYLCENYHPHTHVTVTSTTAELSEGIQAYTTDEYVKD